MEYGKIGQPDHVKTHQNSIFKVCVLGVQWHNMKSVKNYFSVSPRYRNIFCILSDQVHSEQVQFVSK
jgi:hypothetical protein